MTVTLVPGAAVVVLTDNVGAGTIVNVSDPDVPPPGGGVDTDTSAVPTVPTSAAATAARSCVPLT
jgi:hypothetical protein